VEGAGGVRGGGGGRPEVGGARGWNNGERKKAPRERVLGERLEG